MKEPELTSDRFWADEHFTVIDNQSHAGIVSDRPAICTCGLHEVSGGNSICDWCIAEKNVKEMMRLLTKEN